MKSVSIIVPIYNAEAFIKRCFDNICAQTYSHSDIECIFVNDGSTDQSENFAQTLISSNQTDIRFLLVSHDHNRGVSAARNTGIDAAKNTYIYFMDADDTITPDCIQMLVEATETYPDADVICGNSITKKSGLYHHDTTKAFTSTGKVQNLHDTLLFIYASYPYNKLVAKNFLLEHQLYFPLGIPYFEDLHWNIDLARHCHTMTYLPQVTYIYEDVSTSVMGMSTRRANTVATCYMSLIEKGHCLNEPDNIIEIHLFIFFYVMKLLTMEHFNSVDRHNIKKARRLLISQSIIIRKPLLFLYDLQLYQPLRWLSELKFLKNRSVGLRLWICRKCK